MDFMSDQEYMKTKKINNIINNNPKIPICNPKLKIPVSPMEKVKSVRLVKPAPNGFDRRYETPNPQELNLESLL